MPSHDSDFCTFAAVYDPAHASPPSAHVLLTETRVCCSEFTSDPGSTSTQTSTGGNVQKSWTTSAAPSSSDSASPQENSCDADFLNALSEYSLAQSTTAPQWWYFMMELTTREDPDSHAAFCIANFGECFTKCMDFADFQYATGYRIADLCRASGLM